MSNDNFSNSVRQARLGRLWSQAELARRAGISRAAVSAIEIQRLVPSVQAALALAQALECRVEDLFGTPGVVAHETQWAWPAERTPCRFWQAEVGGRRLLFPVESAAGETPHDGVWDRRTMHEHGLIPAEQTLVIASCDPAAGLLAAEYARTSSFRMIVIPRSSSQALTLLGSGLIHLAGVHLSKAGARQGNARPVREQLGPGYTIIHVARWDAGVATARQAAISSVGAAVRSRKRWVGREPGSGARQCLDELLDDRDPPRQIARDHRGVAEAIRSGWADLGVCVRLVAEDASLKFLKVRSEAYDLVCETSSEADPRIKALIHVLRSTRYRELLSELPGYDVKPLGEIERVST